MTRTEDLLKMNAIDMVESLASSREGCCAIKGADISWGDKLGATGHFSENFCVIDGQAYPGMSLQECTEKKGVWYDNVQVFSGVNEKACSNYATVKSLGANTVRVSGPIAQADYTLHGTERKCNPDAMENCVDETSKRMEEITGGTAQRLGPDTIELTNVENPHLIAPFQGLYYTRANHVERSCIMDKKKCNKLGEEVHSRAFRTSILTIVCACVIPILLAYLIYVLLH